MHNGMNKLLIIVWICILSYKIIRKRKIYSRNIVGITNIYSIRIIINIVNISITMIYEYLYFIISIYLC